MEQYYLADFSKDENGMKLNKGPQISQQEYVQLFEYFRFTGFYRTCRSVKNMTIECATDLEKFLYSLQQTKKPTSLIDEQLTTGNKLLISFLSFIRTFFDVTNHAISQWSEAGSDSFSCLNSALYDEFFGYRFFTRMRNYVIHYNMPLTTIHESLSSGVVMYCDRNQLLQYDRWSTVKKEIEQLPERIDIAPYIIEAKVAISTLYLRSLETVVMSALEASEKISEVCEKNNIASPVIVTLHDNDRAPTIKTFPLQLLREFFIDLKDHPDYKIEISQDEISVIHHG